jgi:hypothetical protein
MTPDSDVVVPDGSTYVNCYMKQQVTGSVLSIEFSSLSVSMWSVYVTFCLRGWICIIVKLVNTKPDEGNKHLVPSYAFYVAAYWGKLSYLLTC